MEDVWRHIFSYLTVREQTLCESVCKEWRRRVADHQRHWKEVDFGGDELQTASTSEDHIQNVLERCGTAVRSFSFGQKNGVNAAHNIFPSNVHLNRRHMLIVAAQPRLKRLIVNRMIITLRALEQFENISETLEELVLNSCHLDVYSIEDDELVRHWLKQLLQKCIQLKKLYITSRGQWSQHFTLSSDLLHALPSTITHLNLSLGEALKIDSLEFLSEMRLSELTLPRTGIKSVQLAVLLCMSNTMESLDLSYSRNIDDFSILAKFSNLKKLNLQGNFLLTDIAFGEITGGCPKLKELNVSDCTQLTYHSLQTLGRLYELERLSISGIPSVRDDVIDHMCNSVNLEYVDITGCRRITERGLDLIMSLPSLGHLRARGVPSLTDGLLKQYSSVPHTVEKDSDPLPMYPLLPPIPTTYVVRVPPNQA